MRRSVALVAAAGWLAACGSAAPGGDGSGGAAGAGGSGGDAAAGAGGGAGTGGSIPTPLFGAGSHLAVVADSSGGLNDPRDLSFHPGRRGELWVVNAGDRSVTIVFDATKDGSRTDHRIDGYAEHFLDNPSSIAFGARNFDDDFTFGTCGESENTYDGTMPPNFYMGPVLWSADLSVFAEVNPIGLGSHLDMLHDSPDCMGIAHDHDNVYWVFDGYHGQIVRYDFVKDHGPGYDDHSDGIISFLDDPAVKRVKGVPSDLEIDPVAHALYVADTGNNRVLRVDYARVRKTGDLQPSDPGNIVATYGGAVVTELVPASTGMLRKPSGLALHEEMLYVGDNATGAILAFGLDGSLLARLDTGVAPGALMGLEVGPDDRLYLSDAKGNRILRVEP